MRSGSCDISRHAIFVNTEQAYTIPHPQNKKK